MNKKIGIAVGVVLGIVALLFTIHTVVNWGSFVEFIKKMHGG